MLSSTGRFPEKQPSRSPTWQLSQLPSRADLQTLNHKLLSQKKHHLLPWSCRMAFSKRPELKRLYCRGSCIRICTAINLHECQCWYQLKRKEVRAKSIWRTWTQWFWNKLAKIVTALSETLCIRPRHCVRENDYRSPYANTQSNWGCLFSHSNTVLGNTWDGNIDELCHGKGGNRGWTGLWQLVSKRDALAS